MASQIVVTQVELPIHGLPDDVGEFEPLRFERPMVLPGVSEDLNLIVQETFRYVSRCDSLLADIEAMLIDCQGELMIAQDRSERLSEVFLSIETMAEEIDEEQDEAPELLSVPPEFKVTIEDANVWGLCTDQVDTLSDVKAKLDEWYEAADTLNDKASDYYGDISNHHQYMMDALVDARPNARACLDAANLAKSIAVRHGESQIDMVRYHKWQARIQLENVEIEHGAAEQARKEIADIELDISFEFY